MNMKRILTLFTMLALAIPGVQAQSWLDALKKGATTAVDKATGGKLTEMALYGTWTYTQPSVKFEGEGLAASFGGSFIETLIVDQLAKIYARVGLTTGQGTLTFTREKQTVTAAFGTHKIEGTYQFDAESHDITFSLANGKFSLGAVPSHAYLNGSELTIVFPVKRLMEIVQQVGDKIESSNLETLSAAATLLSQYDNAYVGFAFTK